MSSIFKMYDDLDEASPSLRFLLFLVFVAPLIGADMMRPSIALGLVGFYAVIAAWRALYLVRARSL